MSWEVSKKPAEWVTHLDPAAPPRLTELGAEAIPVWHVRLRAMRPWLGPWTPDIAYGKGKATVTDEQGKSVSAEVQVARRLATDGWQARALLITWLAPEHWRPYVAMANNPTALPPRLNELLGALGRGGAPDVLGWTGSGNSLRIAGVECKRVGRDSVKEAQVRWYQRALDEKWIAHADLIVAEWTTAS